MAPTQPYEQRFCTVCKKPNVRRPGEALTTYARRLYCSRACGYKRPKKQKTWPLRTCKGCDQPIQIRTNKNRPERHSEYRKRTYCSTACLNKHHPRNPVAVAIASYQARFKPSDRDREAELYGGRITDAYRVGFIRTVQPLTASR